MNFLLLALSSVPDTATTRQLFDLHDLDDKSVSKVLFHRRKQQTGASEELRWDQRAIAAITLLQHSAESTRIDSMTFASHSEAEMLRAFFAATRGQDLTVSWDGRDALLPLIRFRTLLHAITCPSGWQWPGERDERHIDIRHWLSPTRADRPELDETARKLGFPGMLQHSEDHVVQDWLRGDHAALQAHSELNALNSYLLALRLFTVTGRIDSDELARAQQGLRDELGQREAPHRAAFLAAWSGR